MENEKKLTGYLIKSNGDFSVEEIDRENELQELYRILECDTIDIVERMIGGRLYDITCDDEALLKADPIITAVSSTAEPMLFGNLFITTQYLGELVSLSADDISRIRKSALRLAGDRPDGLAPRLLICDYPTY